MTETLKKRLKRGDLTFGTWLSVGNPDIPDILETLPFDWFVFDTEHSPISMETVSHMIQVVDDRKIAPLVRVGMNDQYLIKQALDIGSHGVVVPLVNSRSDAELAVKFCKYPPLGIRGVAPRKSADYGSRTGEYIRRANDEVILVVQIETKQALENIDQIMSVEELDVVFVGPSDLTMSLGLVDDRLSNRVREAMKLAVSKCHEYGKVPGTMASTTEEAKSAVSLGFRFVSLASDTRYLVEGAKSFLASVKRS